MENISGNTYVLRGATNVGVYLNGEVLYLVDSGTSKKVLREVLELFAGKKVILLNTHHHADHISLNAWLQARTGCDIYAPIGEISMIANPILEGYVLYSAEPPKSLRKEFFTAKPSIVKPLNNDLILKPINLPGHTLDHTGYLTPDGVLLSGDLYFSAKILDKYFYPYHASIPRLRKSLERLESLNYEYVVPSHGEPTDDPSPDVNHMMERIEFMENEILKFLKDPHTVEELTEKLERDLELNLKGGFWYLFRSFVSALLQDMEERGDVHGEGMVWMRR